MSMMEAESLNIFESLFPSYARNIGRALSQAQHDHES